MKRLLSILALTVLALGISAAAPPAASTHADADPLPTYRVIDLGTHVDESFPTGINAANVVSGWAGAPVLWKNGTPIALAGAGSSGEADGVNDDGDTAGIVDGHAVVWRGGVPTTLPGLFQARAGADDGTVAADGAGADGKTHAFRVGPDGVAQQLPDVFANFSPGGGHARAINARGDIAGWGTSDFGFRGALWVNGESGIRILQPLPGRNNYGFANGLNDADDVVGYSAWTDSTNRSVQHATLWSSSGTTDLGTLGAQSAADDINNNGDIVGYADTADFEQHAVLWRDGRLIDLTQQVTNLGAWLLGEAVALNDSGVIVGIGTLDGDHERAFMLCPTELVTTTGACGEVPELDAIEVNQSVQNWRDTIPLTEGKATYVRVFVRWPYGGTKPVHLELVGQSSLGDLPGSPLQPLNGTFTATSTVDRAHLAGSVNFRLPPAWTHGTVTLTVQQTAPADGSARPPLDCRDGAGDPDDCAVAVSFDPVGALKIRIVGVAWTDDATGISYAAPDFFAAQEEAQRLKAIYPSARVDWDYVDGGHAHGSVVLPSKIAASALWDAIMPSLLGRRIADGCGAGCNTLYLGLVANPSGIALGGRASDIPGLAAVAGHITGLSHNRATLAHEVGHDLGDPHAVSSTLGLTADGDKQGWCGEVADGTAPDWTDTYTIGGATYPALGPMSSGDDAMIYGLDTVTADTDPTRTLGAVSPTAHFELMGYCDHSAYANDWNWISATTYLSAIQQLNTRFAAPSLRALQQARRRTTDPPPLIVRGRIDALADTVRFLPFGTPPAGTNVAAVPAGPYTLEARDAGGALVASVPFAVDPGHTDGPDGGTPVTVGDFVIAVPGDGTVASVDVMRGGTELGSATATAHTPSVRVVSPNGGESLSGAATISWSADDADGDVLTSTVQYSADGGATWRTLALDVSGNTYALDTSTLPGSAKALVRVQVSDGFRTASDTSDAVFSVATHAPTIAISSPQTLSSFASDESISLVATAFDVEDGDLAPTAFRWTVDGREVARNSDAVLDASSLAGGAHTATVTATDSSGLTASTAVRFAIGTGSTTEPPSSGGAPPTTPSPTPPLVPVTPTPPTTPTPAPPTTTTTAPVALPPSGPLTPPTLTAVVHLRRSRAHATPHGLTVSVHVDRAATLRVRVLDRGHGVSLARGSRVGALVTKRRQTSIVFRRHSAGSVSIDLRFARRAGHRYTLDVHASP